MLELDGGDCILRVLTFLRTQRMVVLQGGLIMQVQHTRRVCPRLPTSFLVHCQRADLTKIGGKAYNASAGGMAIKTNYPIRVGEELTVEFQVPDTPGPVKVAGEVTWRQFHGDSPSHAETLFTAGIKFLNPEKISPLFSRSALRV